MGNLQHSITTGRATLPITTFLAILCWGAIYMFIPELPVREVSYPLWHLVWNFLPDWSERLLSLTCCLIIGYSLIQLNNTYGLIRRRASVQTSMFLLFVAACPPLHVFYLSDVTAIMVLIAVYNLFKCYQSPNAAGNILNTFVFLGTGSLIFPQLTLFAPVFLIGIQMFNTLNLRNFIAAILGWFIPYWFLWAYAYYTGNMELFYLPFTELAGFQPLSIDYLNLQGWVTYAYFFIIFGVTGTYCFINKNKDNIRTRICMRFIILFTATIFIYTFLQPVHAMNMLLIMLAGTSILAAHFFVLTDGKASNWFLIGIIIGLFLLFGFNIWTLV